MVLVVNPFLDLLDGDAVITVRLNGVDTALLVIGESLNFDVQIVESVVAVAASDFMSLQVETTSRLFLSFSEQAMN